MGRKTNGCGFHALGEGVALFVVLVLCSLALFGKYVDRFLIEGLKFDSLLGDHIPSEFVCIGVTTSDLQNLTVTEGWSDEDVLDAVDVHGMAIIPEVLSVETAAKVREYVNHTNHAKVQDQFLVMKPERRFSTKLSVYENESLKVALKEIAEHPRLRKLLDQVLGPKAALLELVAITNQPGAEAQDWHSDILYDYTDTRYPHVFMPMFSLAIALQDTTEEMGATSVCPGTIPECLDDKERDENCIQAPMKQGSAMLYNNMLSHRGSAHVDMEAEDRIILFLTLAPARTAHDQRVLPVGSTFSLTWDMWGHTLDEFPAMLIDKPWRWWHSLGDLLPYFNRNVNGYGYFYTMMYQIANGDEFQFRGRLIGREDIRNWVENLVALAWVALAIYFAFFDFRSQFERIAARMPRMSLTKTRSCCFSVVLILWFVTIGIWCLNEIYIESFKVDYTGHETYNDVCEGVSTKNFQELVLKESYTLDDNEALVKKHGVAILPDLLSKETAASLHEHINRTNYENEANQFHINDKFKRFSTKIDVNANETLAIALKEIAESKVLRPLIDRLLGPHSAVLELHSITSQLGAYAQQWHKDVPPRHDDLFFPMYSLAVALQDTTEDMGATGICPGTQLCVWEGDPDVEEQCMQPPLQTGHALLWNMETVHRGSAYVDGNSDRIILLMSLGASQSSTEKREMPFGPTYSLRSDLCGHVIDELSTLRERPWKWWHALGMSQGDVPVYGYSLWHLMAHHIANGSFWEFKAGATRIDKVLLNWWERMLICWTCVATVVYAIVFRQKLNSARKEISRTVGNGSCKKKEE